MCSPGDNEDALKKATLPTDDIVLLGCGTVKLTGDEPSRLYIELGGSMLFNKLGRVPNTDTWVPLNLKIKLAGDDSAP